jgi:Hemerythrin HHE cation binding domain
LTPTAPAPNLGQDLIRIHKVITRAIYTSLIKGREYRQSGFPQHQLLIGYSAYVHCLSEVLCSHHRGEDLIAFPAFIKVLPSAPYAQLFADHRAIDCQLRNIRQALTDLSSDTPEKGLVAIIDTVEKLSALWEPHILLEEHYFSKKAVNAAIDLDEQKRIGEAVAKHSQDHSGPPYWVIPFILYNLEPEERAIMAENFPPEIMNELIPVVWKDQWAPMKPLLLN